MRNDSIESLLQYHYGSAASSPAGLEHRLHASVHNTAAAAHAQEQRVSRNGMKKTRIKEKKMNI